MEKKIYGIQSFNICLVGTCTLYSVHNYRKGYHIQAEKKIQKL